MPTFEQRGQQIIRFVQERQTALASGLAALLIIVVGFLVFNFFLNVNKDTVPQETATEESTESAELNPTETPETTVTSTPTPTPEKETIAQVSPGGAASVTVDQEYIVVKGDTLGKIAQKFYNDSKKWTQIAQANKLTNPSLIHAGNKLIIPRSETGVAVTTISPAPASSSGNVEYVVSAGDTLWQISVDFYGSGFDWYKIRDANLDKVRTLSNGRPGITPGQHLIIP